MISAWLTPALCRQWLKAWGARIPSAQQKRYEIIAGMTKKEFQGCVLDGGIPFKTIERGDKAPRRKKLSEAQASDALKEWNQGHGQIRETTVESLP